MNSDDYAKRQSQRDAQYEKEYEAWVKSMTPAERRNAEKLGVLKPCVQRHGNGAPEHDMADSPLASHEPDIAALVDHEEEQPETHSMGSATEILRRLVADILSEDNTRLTMDCLAIALGLRVYAGDSMTKIAKRHGISRAAVSKRCVDITERLKLPPSRAMRSENARKTYRNSQIEQHLRNNP
jgi:DNA-binding phage protein